MQKTNWPTRSNDCSWGRRSLSGGGNKFHGCSMTVLLQEIRAAAILNRSILWGSRQGSDRINETTVKCKGSTNISSINQVFSLVRGCISNSSSISLFPQ